MSSSNIFVLGSTGFVGNAVLASLSKYANGRPIYAGIRNPNAEKALAIAKLEGVTVTKADMGESVETLTRQLAGKADQLLLVTPGTENRAELARNAIDAARAAGTTFIVVVSIVTADLIDTVFGKQFSSIEKAVKDSGIPYCVIRLPLFIDNNWLNAGSIQEQSKFYGPADPDRMYSPVAVSDIGDAAATVLLNSDKHTDTIYQLTQEAFSHRDLASAFSNALGREVQYVQVPYEDAKKAFMGNGFPEWQVDGILELYKRIDAGKYDYESSLPKLLNREPLSYTQWVDSVKRGFQ